MADKFKGLPEDVKIESFSVSLKKLRPPEGRMISENTPQASKLD